LAFLSSLAPIQKPWTWRRAQVGPLQHLVGRRPASWVTLQVFPARKNKGEPNSDCAIVAGVSVVGCGDCRCSHPLLATRAGEPEVKAAELVRGQGLRLPTCGAVLSDESAFHTLHEESGLLTAAGVPGAWNPERGELPRFSYTRVDLVILHATSPCIGSPPNAQHQRRRAAPSAACCC